MDWPAAVSAIRDRIAAGWTVTPVEWENEAFTPPAGMPWISVSVVEVDGDVAGIRRPGDHRLRIHGMIRVEVLTPVGTGTSGADSLIADFVALFRLQTFNEIRAHMPDPAVSPGASDDGLWWITETRIPFYYDTFG